MGTDKPVVIIGAGVVGVCSAYYLAEQKREVVVLDKGEVGCGASWGNAGLLLPSHSVPLACPGATGEGLRWLLDPESPFYIKPRLDWALIAWLWRFQSACGMEHVREAIPLIRDMQRLSAQLYEEIMRRESLQCGYEQKGVLMAYRTQHNFEEGQKEARLLSEYGIEFESLDDAGIRKKEPSVLPEVVGGIYYPEDCHLDPASFVTELARVCAHKGVAIRSNTEVIALVAQDKEVSRVITTRGDFEPTDVVLAGGAWSPSLVRNLNISLPIQPAKGYSITVDRPVTSPTVPMLLKEVRVAVTPLGTAMRLAGTLELAGLDMSINLRRVEAILRGARQFLSGMEKLEIREIWRGLRPCTPDGLPIIGRSMHYHNLVIAAGHATIGQALGPVTGRLVGQIVNRERTDIDINKLQAERF